jgi:hypothetical protein
MNLNKLYILFIAMIFISENVVAESEIKKNDDRCPAIGIVQIKQYIRKREMICIPSAKNLEQKGFNLFTSLTVKVPKKNRPNCKFVGVKEKGISFAAENLICLASEKKAVKKGYIEFEGFSGLSSLTPASATATSVPNETPGGPTPGPNSTPSSIPTVTPIAESSETPNPQSSHYWKFILGETTPGSGYLAQCSASLNEALNRISIQCTHNVANAFEAHIHPAPDNNKFCVLPNPPLNMIMNCDLKPEEAQAILEDRGLLSIHLALGAANQAVAGYIRN